jgi:hypothetical protein
MGLAHFGQPNRACTGGIFASGIVTLLAQLGQVKL